MWFIYKKIILTINNQLMWFYLRKLNSTAKKRLKKYKKQKGNFIGSIVHFNSHCINNMSTRLIQNMPQFVLHKLSEDSIKPNKTNELFDRMHTTKFYHLSILFITSFSISICILYYFG